MSDSTARQRALRLLAADEDPDALERFAAMARSLGHEVIASAVDLAEATEAVAREDPDLAVVVVHDDQAHALALIEEIGAFARGPVVALLDEDDAAFVADASERGIFASCRPTDAETLQSALTVALDRHAEMERLAGEVGQLQGALERRALIERAKGILMERHGLDERAAFERLRSHARSRSARVVDIADQVAHRGLDPGA
ncbi:MAG TPA: ANTAR domain-containing protein [Baekduia sp.]|nr:ANTAR domain-containing protein [Baekduia sp.]